MLILNSVKQIWKVLKHDNMRNVDHLLIVKIMKKWKWKGTIKICIPQMNFDWIENVVNHPEQYLVEWVFSCWRKKHKMLLKLKQAQSSNLFIFFKISILLDKNIKCNYHGVPVFKHNWKPSWTSQIITFFSRKAVQRHKEIEVNLFA